jgi:SAM-dependent methyltransferase
MFRSRPDACADECPKIPPIYTKMTDVAMSIVSYFNATQWFIVLLIVVVYASFMAKNMRRTSLRPTEHFNDYNVRRSCDEIYDSFYASIYNDLFKSDLRQQFEVYNIKAYSVENTMFAKKANFLDIGCGTGEHMSLLLKEGFPVTGIDTSNAMLTRAKKATNANCSLIRASALTTATFAPATFTHAMMMFFTIYYFKPDDLPRLFSNVNKWLKPRGFFIVHLVNPSLFDPVLERASSMVPLYNPQKHSKKRKTETKMFFDRFNYVADWSLDSEPADFIETFTFEDGSTMRRNEHKLNMMPIKYYVDCARDCGFGLHKIIDLAPARHIYNYLYIFKKKEDVANV